MANGKSGRKKESAAKKQLKKKLKEWLKIILIIAIILVLAKILGVPLFGEGTNTDTDIPTPTSTPVSDNNSGNTNVEGELLLTMIDVGQADSFLLEQNGMTALVDCGTRSSGDDVVEYLKSQGITKIDFLFGTHPHDDHMGGMYDIITNIEIGTIIIPEVKLNKITANWYAKLMTEIKNGDYNLQYVKEGTTYYLGEATMKVLGPINEPKSNLNNYSTILKVSFGEMDIIMTGDAETDLEKEILAKYRDELDAEILKVGHHGSDTSTSDEFLEAVSPDYALVSAGLGNKHEHPIKSIMEKFEDAKIPVYRTDESGTVEVRISATAATFSCEPGDYLSGPELEEKENTK